MVLAAKAPRYVSAVRNHAEARNAAPAGQPPAAALLRWGRALAAGATPRDGARPGDGPTLLRGQRITPSATTGRPFVPVPRRSPHSSPPSPLAEV